MSTRIEVTNTSPKRQETYVHHVWYSKLPESTLMNFQSLANYKQRQRKLIKLNHNSTSAVEEKLGILKWRLSSHHLQGHAGPSFCLHGCCIPWISWGHQFIIDCATLCTFRPRNMTCSSLLLILQIFRERVFWY